MCLLGVAPGIPNETVGDLHGGATGERCADVVPRREPEREHRAAADRGEVQGDDVVPNEAGEGMFVNLSSFILVGQGGVSFHMRCDAGYVPTDDHSVIAMGMPKWICVSKLEFS